MTDDDRKQIAQLNKAIADVQATLDEINTKIDVAQSQNVRHIEHLRGDFKESVEARADRSDILAYESSEQFAQAHRQNLRLSEINAQLVERIEPLCNTLNALTTQLRGLIGLTAAK